MRVESPTTHRLLAAARHRVAPVRGSVIGGLLVSALAVALAACSGAPAPTPGQAAASAVPLAAGTYTSKAFSPAVTYTLPSGWDNPEDTAAYFQIRPAGSEAVGVYVFRDPVAMSQDGSCPDTAALGVGTAAKDLATWMAALPGVVSSDPKPATVGGLTGYVVDLGIKDTWKQSCSFANGSPTVPLFLNTAAGYHWIMAGSERIRLFLLDLPKGGTVAVDIDAFDGSLVDQLLTEATPIVSSMKFALL